MAKKLYKNIIITFKNLLLMFWKHNLKHYNFFVNIILRFLKYDYAVWAIETKYINVGKNDFSVISSVRNNKNLYFLGRQHVLTTVVVPTANFILNQKHIYVCKF